MDRNTVSALGQIRYALSRRTTLVVSGEALEDRFFSQPATLPPERQSYRCSRGLRVRRAGRRLGPPPRWGFASSPAPWPRAAHPTRAPWSPRTSRGPSSSFARLHVTGDRDVLYASSLVDVGTLRYRNAFVYHRYLGEVVLDLPLECLGFFSAGFEESDYLLPYPYPTATSLIDRVDHRYTVGMASYAAWATRLRVGWARGLGPAGEQSPAVFLRGPALRPHCGDPSMRPTILHRRKRLLVAALDVVLFARRLRRRLPGPSRPHALPRRWPPTSSAPSGRSWWRRRSSSPCSGPTAGSCSTPPSPIS